MRLVISLATRGRPQQLMDTVAKSIVNWRSDTTIMQLQIDADDQATIAHLNQTFPLAWSIGPCGPRVIVNIQPREDTIAAKWNRALAIPGDVYLCAADDDPYVTEGYDAKILEAAKLFDDGIGMVYGHMANLSFSGVVAPTIKLIEKLGHIQPEHFPYWFCDHWTDDVARMIGRIVVADIRTDQSMAGVTQEMREPWWWSTWFDAAYLLRRKIAFDIIDSPEFHETPAAKARLKTHHHRVEFYSRWVNESMRQQTRALPLNLSLKDERYLRVKNKALAMLPDLLAMDGMDPVLAMKYKNELDPPTTILNIKQAYA